MKIKNIKFSCFAYDGNMKMLGHRFFVTETALSKWANNWYRKDENVTVNVYDFETRNLIITYHA